MTARTAAAALSATAAPYGTAQMSSIEAIAKTRAHNRAKHAIALASVHGKAAPRRVFGRHGLPLHAVASQTLIGMEE